MKAIFIEKYGIPKDAFVLKDIPAPTPSKGQVLVKVDAFGINFADVTARKGLYKAAPKPPFVPGYEVVGRIEKQGDSNFLVGTRVIAFTRFGGYSEFVCADERVVIAIEENISNGVALALCTQYSTAYYSAIRSANVQRGEKVLIHAAAGGVGTAFVQLCKLFGCEVTATASSDEKLDYARSQGADFIVNYTNEDFAHTLSPKKFDVIFDSVGGSVFKRNRKLLDTGGRLVCFGGSERATGSIIKTLKFVFDMGFFHPIGLLMKSQTITGVNMLTIADNKPQIIQDCLTEVLKLYKEGKVHPQVYKEYLYTEISLAHEEIENRKTTGKLVVRWV